MKTLTRMRRNQIAAAIALTLGALSPVWAEEPARSFAEMVEKVALVPAGTHDSEMLAKVTSAVGFIKQMDLPRAHQAANEALQLDPRNSYLHFLNGFIYHLQALQGDTQKGELALEGYQQSLRIDSSNWIAQEFLGLAYLDLKRFDQAKLAFSETLLLTPDSAPSINGLMVSSYLTGDAKTACAMADHFLKVSAQPSLEFMRSSISVYASCGSFGRAAWIRAALIQRYGEVPELVRIDRRLAQWKTFYKDREQIDRALQTGMTDNGPTLLVAQAFSDSAVEDTTSSSNDEPAADFSATPTGDADSGPRMILVDVVLLSTQELMSTAKGVNLLNALTLQLGSVAGNLPAYSRVFNSDSPSGGDTTSNTAITRAVTIPALSYSLNIANANSSVNEVLARPALAAIEGMPSEFFSGTNLSAGVVSTSQEGGTTVVPLEKRFGINLTVTPNFLPERRVQLQVTAQRTSLNASSDNPRVAYQIEIGETTANANVVMNLGETLVLSGLSEKSSSSTRDGVPGLQAVPGLQYFFSHKRTNEMQRSVLILVTPRVPVPVSEAAASDTEPMATRMHQSRMQRLRERFGFADRIPPNIDAIMTQLQGNEHYREFRQGDVTLERWHHTRTTGDRLKEALSFLYY